MGFRTTSFEFDADGTFATAIQIADIDWDNSVVKLGTFPIPFGDLPGLQVAVQELLGQPVDDVIDTEKTLLSGLTVEYDPVALTIKFGTHPAMPTAKAESFVAGLVAHNLI